MARVTLATNSAATGAVERGSVQTVQERANGEGEDGAELTVVAASVKAGSGKAWGSRSDDGDLVGRSLKTTAIAMKRSSPGLLCSVRRERGSRRSWEACRGGEGRLVAAAMANGGDRRVRTRERERGRGEEESGESERVRGGVATRGIVQSDEGGARQAGRLVAWRGGARVRRARSPPSVEDEDDRGGGGLGRLLAGPACCCWVAQGGGPGKSPSFIFVFYFFDICFDLIKILNHLITLCQFL